MPQSISHTTIPDRWAPVSNTTKTEPLRLIKRRPTTPGLPEDHGSSSPPIVSAYTNGVSNLTLSESASAIRRPHQNTSPVPFSDPNDPAFSSDPYQHPDHSSPLLTSDQRKEDVGKNSSPRMPSLEAEAEPPPSYYDSVPISSQKGPIGHPQMDDTSATSSVTDGFAEEGQGSNHIRERARASYSPASTPFTSSSNLPQPQQSERDGVPEQEELLAYLSDERNEPDGMADRNVPISLRPRQGLPFGQAPTDMDSRLRQAPDTTSTGLIRSTTLPASTTRTMSEPLARTNPDRPHLPRRGNTTGNAPTPHRVPAELDRIDELDESTPLGVSLHHRGPYEMRGKVDTPPPRRALPLDRQQKSPSKQHVLVATTPLNAPPPPIPFKLNLKPGEFLTRVPPSRSQTAPPERNPSPAMYPAPAEHPVFGQRQPIPQSILQNRVDPRNVYRENGHHANEWSPEQLYDDHSVSLPPMARRDIQRPPYQAPVRDKSALSSTNTSRSDLRPDLVTNSYPKMQQDRVAPPRRVSFQPTPQQSSMLSRSSSQPVYPSSASEYSVSSSAVPRAPPSAADRHRPKRIVLPGPLQQQNQNTTYTLPSELVRRAGQNGAPINPPPPSQPAAAVIPIHDPKKGNFLKKRASTGASAHQHHNHLAPGRTPSTKGFFGLGLGFGKSITPEPEVNLPKGNRKLSKRGNI